MKKLVTKGFYFVSAIILLIGMALPASAQLFTRTGNLETGGLYTALAKDASNNLYVTRVTPGSGGATYQVVEYLGGAGSPVVIYSGLTHEFGDYPWGLTVTSTGNVFISTDFTSGGGAIIKLTKSGGSYVTSTYQTGRYFTALAVDGSDNLYATEYDAVHSTYAVVKYPANSAANTAGTNLYDALIAGPGYTYPTGLAISPNNDVYVAEGFSNDLSITYGGRLLKLKASSGYSVNTIAGGRYVTSLAFDAFGNLFASEIGTTNYRLSEYTGGGTTRVLAYSPMKTNGVYYPWGIAVMNADKVFAVDGDDGTLGGAVMKLLSNNSTLSNLTTTAGSISFDPAVTNYKATITSATNTITVTPTVADANSTVKINGTTVTSGAPSQNITMSLGINNVYTVVTAPDGISTTTYTLTVTRQSNNADLSNLTYNEGDLSPAFAVATTAYTSSVPNDVSQVTVTPTTANANATVTVNGTGVASGTQSGYIGLVVGPNVVSTVVTSQDGTHTKTYTLTITRAPSANANLNNLLINGGGVVLNPGFSYATTSYTASVNSGTSSVTVTPFTADTGATIKVNGTTVASGGTSASIPLFIGVNNITTVVTAQDGTTTKTYTVAITRVSNNADLSNVTTSSGTLNPAFVSATTTYTSTVSNATASITVTPTAVSAGSTITVNGTAVASGTASPSIPLNIAVNTISIFVTAQNGTTTQTYTLKVTRLSTNASLQTMAFSNGIITPDFTSDVFNYTGSVSNAISSITVTPTVVNSNASLTVNGVAVTSGTASASIPLAIGPNTVTIVTTAQDGTTHKTYTTVITRLAASLNYGAAKVYSPGGVIAPLSPAGPTGVSAPAYGTPFVLANGFSAPGSICVDAAGNVYVPDTYNNVIEKIPAGGGAPTVVGSGLNHPAAVAIDATGNLYVADNGTSTVIKIPVGGGPNITLISSGLNLPNGIAVDTKGNVFVADTYHDQVKMIPVGTTSVTVVGSGFNHPSSLAADPYGNIYVCSSNNIEIDMLSAGSFNTTVVATATNGLTSPWAIALDGAGNLYVTNPTENTVLKIPKDGSPTITLGSGFLHPQGVAADGKGNVIVSNTFNNDVRQMTPIGGYYVNSLPQGLSFSNTTGSFTGTLLASSPATNYTVYGYSADVSISGTANIQVLQTAKLLDIHFLDGTPISPAFTPTTTSYTASVVNAVTSISIAAVTADANSTMTINGSPVLSGAAFGPIALVVGTNTITVVVTAGDGVTTKTYTVKVSRQSNNANLASLALSSGTLNPVFDNATTSYTATVVNATTSVTVTPTAVNGSATITVNGVAVASGAASVSIPLNVGNNAITTVVTSADGTATKTFTVTVSRQSNNANLTSLALNHGTLSPVFNNGTANYTASVNQSVTTIKVTPTAVNGSATIKVNGVSVASGTASSNISLALGPNTVTTVTTSADGTATKTFTVTVTRLSNGLNSLYLPGSGGETPLVSSLGETVEANNILSLNGDGVNDIWVVKNIAFYPNNLVTVYNREGKVVFTKRGYTNDWAGTYRGSVLNEGTYYFSVDLGNGTVKKGFITVVGH